MPRVNRTAVPPVNIPMQTFPSINLGGSSSNALSILSTIQEVKRHPESMLMSIYGNPKTGKTRLACTFPKPLLVIGPEDGTKSVMGVGGQDKRMITHTEQMGQLLSALSSIGWKSPWRIADKPADPSDPWERMTDREGRPVFVGVPYRTIVFDNGTKFRDMLVMEISGGKGPPPSVRGAGSAVMDFYAEVANIFKQEIRPVMGLARDQLLNVVIIAQEANLNEGSKVEQSDLIKPNIGPALGKSVSDFITAECDYVGQTVIRPVTVTEMVQQMDGAPPIPLIKRGEGVEYCLRVQPNEVYRAGFRVNLGVKIQNEFMVDPSWEKLVRLIIGGDKK